MNLIFFNLNLRAETFCGLKDDQILFHHIVDTEPGPVWPTKGDLQLAEEGPPPGSKPSAVLHFFSHYVIDSFL